MKSDSLTSEQRRLLGPDAPKGNTYRPDLVPPADRNYSGSSRRHGPPSFLEFGNACRLVFEDHLLHQLEPLGITRRGFRSWMKCLRVPAVEIGRKGSRYYDTLTLQMAIKFMASLGGPEVVYVPGCRSIYHAQKSPTELDLEQIRSRMGQVINELVSQHVPLTTKNTREISRAVGEAARRMIDQIHEEMERLDAKAEFDEQLIQQQRNVGEPIPEGPDPDPVASPSGGEADIL